MAARSLAELARRDRQLTERLERPRGTQRQLGDPRAGRQQRLGERPCPVGIGEIDDRDDPGLAKRVNGGLAHGAPRSG
ncbi:hypothetical protein GCM10010461_20950 [Microbacterium aurantiacum]